MKELSTDELFNLAWVELDKMKKKYTCKYNTLFYCNLTSFICYTNWLWYRITITC